MKREVKFDKGFNCSDFKCIIDSDNCYPESGGFHGVHGMDIIFYIKDVEGAVQFKLSTGWIPSPDISGIRKIPHELYPMSIDLGYHSRKSFYKDQFKTKNCPILDGDTCYYDGSGLDAIPAFRTLVNAGEEALWNFLEQYYLCVFREGKFPKEVKYPKEER